MVILSVFVSLTRCVRQNWSLAIDERHHWLEATNRQLTFQDNDCKREGSGWHRPQQAP